VESVRICLQEKERELGKALNKVIKAEKQINEEETLRLKLEESHL